MTVNEICAAVDESRCAIVEVTGGEPLEQLGCIDLLHQLLSSKKTVLLETSGAVSIQRVPEDVHVVMDLKTPGSGMEHRNLSENLRAMERRKGEIKIVVTGEDDFLWARRLTEVSSLDTKHSISISPVLDNVSLQDVAAWILQSGLRLRLQVQLHKIVWPDATEER